MGSTAGAGFGLIPIILAIVIPIMAILTFLIPWFVYQSKGELTRIRKVMTKLSNELDIIKKEREQQNKPKPLAKKKKPYVKKRQWAEFKQEESESQNK